MNKTFTSLSFVSLLCCFTTIMVFSQSPDHRDWYNQWAQQAILNKGNGGGRMPASTTSDLAQRLSYEPGRYLLPAFVYASQVDAIESAFPGRAQEYLNDFNNKAQLIFNGDYYRDVGLNMPLRGGTPHANGLNDGFRGWSNANFTSNFAIPVVFNDTTSYDIRVRVFDNGLIATARRCTVQVWINNSGSNPDYQEVYNPFTILNDSLRQLSNEEHQMGTVALLSGWSDVRFQNFKIFEISNPATPVLLYDAVQRRNQFQTDWMWVGNAVNPDLTANWDNWTINPSNGEIFCNAASDAHPSIPTSSRFYGKYAALVLDTTATGISQLSLRNIEITFTMRIEKRNIANAESGVAFRWRHPTGGSNTSGEVRNYITNEESNYYIGYPDPTHQQSFSGGGSGVLTTRYEYFIPATVYMATKFRPHNIIQAIHHSRHDDGNGNWVISWWIGPWDEDAYHALNKSGYADEASNYDGQIIGTIELFNLRTSLGQPYIQASDASDGPIEKWEQIWNRNTSDWNYGGQRLQTYGGWEKGLCWASHLGRTGLMFSRMYKLGGGQHASFCANEYQSIANEFVNNIFWVDPLTDAYQFGDTRDYMGEMGNDQVNNVVTDVGHAGPMVAFLIDAHSDSAFTGIHFGIPNQNHMGRLTRTFTEKIWNRRVDGGTNIGWFMNGNNYVDRWGVSHFVNVLCDWPLLSKYDFKVWEIIDGFCNLDVGTWNLFTTGYLGLYGRVAVDMLYTVRYGIPRNLRMINIQGCNANGYVLRWYPPSDYPIGRGGRPGTRLQYYNIYRGQSTDGGTTWNPYQQVAHINIYDKSPTIQGIQEDYDYPFWQDSTAQTNGLYKYIVRTQDWSRDITNESFNSNEVTVQYAGTIVLVNLPDRSHTQFSFTADAIVLQQNKTFDGLWYIPRDLEVSAGVTMTVNPDAVITFAKGTELLVHGNLNGIDAPDLCYITFQGEDDTPGCWWGISMFDVPVMSNHQLFHCRIKNGVNNIVIYNDESRLEQCDIFGARDYGVIYGRGFLHTHIGNQIHDNGTDNMLIVGNVTYPTHPTINSDNNYGAITGHGIAIWANAYPTITSCMIHNNAKDGIHVWFCNNVSNYPTIFGCQITYNGNHGIDLSTHANATVRQCQILLNAQEGINVNDYSLLDGSLSYGVAASNLLSQNRTNLLLNFHSACWFGVFIPNPGNDYAHLNCFELPVNNQVEAYASSIAIVEKDYFDPDAQMYFLYDQTSQINRVDIPGCPIISPIAPMIGGSEVRTNDSKEMSMKKSLRTSSPIIDTLVGLLRSKSYNAVLTLLQNPSPYVSASNRELFVTVYNVLLSSPVWSEAAVQIKEQQRIGVFGETDAASLLATVSMREGKYSRAIEILRSFQSSSSIEKRRSSLLTSAYALAIIGGADTASTYLAAYGDGVLTTNERDEFNSYFKWIERRADHPDSLEKQPIEISNSSPEGYSLLISPNPFNPTTTVYFAIPQESYVRLSVFDAIGREVKVLAGREFDTGMHSIVFSAENLPSGIYYCRVTAGKASLTRRLTLLR